MDKKIVINYVDSDKLLDARRALDQLIELPMRNEDYFKYILTRAVEYIKNNYMNKITLKATAEILAISEAYLCKLFKKYMYISFKQYVNFVRIKEAERLLKETDLNIKTISKMLGVEDEGYFTKMFKRIKGCAPKNFRRNYFVSSYVRESCVSETDADYKMTSENKGEIMSFMENDEEYKKYIENLKNNS